MFASSISTPALYRSIEAGLDSSSGSTPKAKAKRRPPTLLLDEAQILKRAGSESGEIFKELLKAGIEKDSKVYRCGSKSKDFKPEGFRTYCPKVVAMIGEPDRVLADRSLLVEMRRKTKEDTVEHLRSREVQPRAEALRKRLEQWAADNEQAAMETYPDIEYLDIGNNRMADLLLPLQTVLLLDGDERRETLLAYATSLEERDKRPESQSAGIRLLTACKEIFEEEGYSGFVPTVTLIDHLVSRPEDVWSRLTPEALRNLLNPYGIRPTQNRKRTQRGYYVADFQDAFKRYL